MRFCPEELEGRIGYTFHDKELLHSALAHSSYTNELKINYFPDYERLEFLGDAVLELTVSDYLYRNKPELKEGEMTKLRSALVCEPTLAIAAKELSLSDYILLGKGEEAQGSRYRDSIVSDVFEALIGAIYLDGGMEAAMRHIQRFVLNDVDEKELIVDSKSSLQSEVQKRGWSLEYRIVNISGPEHSRKYTVEALINGEKVSNGSGSSKKGAEQRAAFEALKSRMLK